MSEVSTTFVIGTAGHIDHGKTALVRALTGRDTDRLPEEKARGISIELGFAPLTLPSGRLVSLVDVPGHERFVRHMVAGASGIDGYVLCVAADDGVMPQTREHVAVLDLLGVDAGVVAITKADRMDPILAVEETRELVGEGHEIVPVCAPSGLGIDELLAAIERLVDGAARRHGGGPPRLFVDRSFSVPGAGTVVTGTLWGHGLTRGERVRVLPSGRDARIRSVEQHDHDVEVAGSGRVALNLAGVERDDVGRGTCVVRASDPWMATERIDVELRVLPDAPGPLRTRRRLQLFLGTSECAATVVVLEGREIAPGATGFAQLRTERPIVAAPGDRVVLRSAERATIAGALVLDVPPARHGRGSGAAERLRVVQRGEPKALLALRLAEAGPEGIVLDDVDDDLLRDVGGMRLDAKRCITIDTAARATDAVLAALAGGSLTLAGAAAASGLGEAAAAALVALLITDGRVERDGVRVAVSGPAQGDSPLGDLLCQILEAAGLQPPSTRDLVEQAGADPDEVGATLARLREAGRVVGAGDLWFDAAAADAATRRAVAALSERALGIGALRDLWGVGRRHALALAAHLDASGLTRRVGDERVLRRSAR